MIFLKSDKYKLTKANALRCYKNNFNSAIVTKICFLKMIIDKKISKYTRIIYA